eukprot:5137405-Amphidinium_carterae.1
MKKYQKDEARSFCLRCFLASLLAVPSQFGIGRIVGATFGPGKCLVTTTWKAAAETTILRSLRLGGRSE